MAERLPPTPITMPARANTAATGAQSSEKGITWNENDWINFPGKNSPWSVSCRYTWEGREYTVQSPLIWREPVRSGPVTVYLDAKKPRQAAVDPDSVATVL